MPTRRCAIYVRISVAQEASVSIDRQTEAAQQYAAARGWQVAAVFRDDGVSATHNKPEDRVGWRALLDSPETFDTVIVWKIDRLARRVLDFLHADETLQKDRRAGIVAVEDPVDMTTSQGRGFATMLAVFAQMEADAIRARVKDARSYLLREGRVVGGTLPYGWRSIPNPSGRGYALAHDPDRIDYVRGMVERVQLGGSIYSVVRWLDAEGVPLPGASQKRRKAGGWSYSTVERLLRNPVLCGMTAFNPGNESHVRGLEVRRGSDGLPVVDPSVAIMSAAEWRKMVRGLDERDSAQSLPVALRSKTSALLSGLVYCGEHDGDGPRMHRGTIQGRHGYYCPACSQAISNFESVVIAEFLRQKGERVRWSVVEQVEEGGAAVLPEIEHRLAELSDAHVRTDDDEEAARLTGQIDALRTMRRKERAAAPLVVERYVRHTHRGTVEESAEDTGLFGEDWAAAETVEERRDVLDDALARITVRKGGTGRRTEAQLLARLAFDWKVPEDVGPIEPPDDATLAAWAE